MAATAEQASPSAAARLRAWAASPALAPWRYAAGVVLLTRLIFLSVAYAGAWMTAPGRGGLGERVLGMWDQWDAGNLIKVGLNGYADPSDPNASAYFPLFPKSVAALESIGVDPIFAGLLINALACVVAFAFLYRLAEEEIGGGAGRRAVLYLAFFPTSVFLVAPYTEPLFLAGAIPAFYYARRGRWHLVGIFAAIAVAARFAGLLLLAGLAAEFVRQWRFTRARLALFGLAMVTALVPFLYYMLLLDRISGNPWLFVEAQRRGWGRGFVGPVQSFLNTWNTWGREDYPTNWIMAWRLEIVAAIAGAAVVGWAIAKREWGYAAFTGALLAVMTTNAWYYSVPRALLTFFPLAIFLAAHTARRPGRHEPILLAFVAFAMMGTLVYTRGAWFF